MEFVNCGSYVPQIMGPTGFNLLGVLQFPCFSHTLQLAVEQALRFPDIAKITAWCKRILVHVNQSAKSYALLRQKQKALGNEQLAVVNDVVTRWNSSYYMVARVLEQQQPLCATLLELKKGDLMPEFANMELFVNTTVREITAGHRTISGQLHQVSGHNWICPEIVSFQSVVECLVG